MKHFIITTIILIGCAWASVPVFAQQSRQTASQRTVTGKVTDTEGLPLVGATILVPGTSQGASTNHEGVYSIRTEGGSLLFQYVGYDSQEVAIGSRTQIDVRLVQSKQSIGEVVVIGYGQVKRSDLTGSVANVKMSDIKDVPVLSVDQALQGRLAGVDIMSTDGEPGSPTSIRIRGTRSISASNEPLIVVDGVLDGVNDLSDLNPSDIESISVLKDASATAIYGSRGSNGVIVITTKQGRSLDGKPNVVFRTVLGFSQLPRQLDIMNADEFARYRNDYAYFTNADGYEQIGPDTPLSQYPYPNPGTYGAGTNWIDEITRTAFYQEYNLSVSGSTKKSSYYASAGISESEGIIDKSGLVRYTTRLRLDHTFAKWLKAGLNLSYTYRDQDENLATIGGTSWWSAAIYLSPFIKPESDTNDLWYSGQKFNNPRAMIDLCTRNAIRKTLNNSGYLELMPVEGLKLRSQFTYYSYQRHGNRYEPGTLPAKKEGEGGRAERQEYNDTNLLSETTAYYEIRPESGHNFDILAGFTAQKRSENNLSMSGSGYTLDELTWNNMAAIPDKQNISLSTSHTDWTKMAILSRLNYNYRDRYYLTLTGRYDGASNFAKNNKWGFFPSMAVRWNAHNEQFMQSVKWIDELSVRFSAGRTGNDAISAYRSLAAVGSSTSGYLFNGSQPLAVYPSRLASPDLTWETTDKYSVGLDFSLFKERLSLTGDWYYDKTRDLLLTIQVATQTGYSNYFANAGRTNNKGFELTLESRNIVRPNFSWSTTLTFSHNKQEVEDIASEEFVTAYSSPSSAGTTYMMYGYRKGYPLNALWGFRYGGVWHNEEEVARNRVTKAYVSASSSSYKPGYARYQDINHDGVLNADDLVYLGTADPDLYGGVQNTFKFRQLTLGVYFNYSIGGKIYNISEIYMGNGSPYTNQYRYMQNAWHPVRNPDSDLPFAGSNDAIPSDRMVHDASYLRLKNVSLSYTFDLKKVSKGYLRDLRVSVSGENLYLWKRYNGFDPDVSSSSSNSALRRVDIGAYPKPRTVIFSLELRY